MILDSPLTVISGLLGLIFIITGVIMKKFPPKKINGLYGYRTTQSMSSQQKWDLAQILSAKLFIQFGVTNTLLGIIGLFLPVKYTIGIIISMCWLIIGIILLFIKTENALKKLN